MTWHGLTMDEQDGPFRASVRPRLNLCIKAFGIIPCLDMALRESKLFVFCLRPRPTHSGYWRAASRSPRKGPE
jgi:hypothetical protein